MYQSCTIVGNVGRDAEMRYTPSGAGVTEFSVAVNVGWGDKKTTQWWSVNAWGKQAETCNQYVKKGNTVLVQGRVEMQEWEKDGQHKSKLVIVADNVRFLSSKRQEQAGPDVGDGENMPF